MIDVFAVLVSCALCLFVAVRATLLDRTYPWFGPKRLPDTKREDGAEVAHPTRPAGWRARVAPGARIRSRF